MWPQSSEQDMAYGHTAQESTALEEDLRMCGKVYIVSRVIKSEWKTETVLVCVCACMCVHVHGCGSQGSTSGLAPQELSSLDFAFVCLF